MSWKTIFSLIFFLVVITLLLFYWFIPLEEINFEFSQPKNTNFTLNASLSENTQFYENMRYPSSDISYRIQDCPLKKSDDMKTAFNIIENKTLLNFYPVIANEEISVTCENKARVEGGLFIAGEGGPVNITRSENFNVIRKGGILLIRESKCENPNIGIHELFHALGFDHSTNPNNIMYEVSKCRQEIGQDTINLLNWLYSFPSQPDLSFENASASMKGRYLDVSVTIKNNGLKESKNTKIIIYADSKPLKEIELDPLEIGHGRIITLTNIFVLQRDIDELEFFINSDFEELNKDNNRITLEIKK